MTDLSRQLVAEALGTAVLVATVVGAGIMAERLTADTALVLLANALATGAILTVLITIFAPVSGAHFNPAVTLVLAMRRDLSAAHAAGYVTAQVFGAVVGTALAHAMFDLPLLQLSAQTRTGAGQWLSEAAATIGLVLAILGGSRLDARLVPALVGLYIAAAYWFTASTSFANPAVTIGRALTRTFSGIAAADVPAFIAAQMVGAVLAALLAGWLFRTPSRLALRRGAG